LRKGKAFYQQLGLYDRCIFFENAALIFFRPTPKLSLVLQLTKDLLSAKILQVMMTKGLAKK
jgi:hypothetical protein